MRPLFKSLSRWCSKTEKMIYPGREVPLPDFYSRKKKAGII